MKNMSKLLLWLSMPAFFCSCKKETVETNDEEVITTLQVRLTPAGGGNPLTFAFRDLDGPGGNAPVIDTIRLSAGSAYASSLVVLNETVNPADSISHEIQAEAEAHRFYYQPAVTGGLTVSNLDTDADGVELGLTSLWVSGTGGSGNITLTLRHYAGTPPGKLSSDPVNSTKSTTDIEVRFPVVVQ